MNIKGILIVIILILGVIFFNKLYTFREGAEEMSAEKAGSFAGDLTTTINQKFESEGLPTIPPEETAQLMQQLMNLMDQEVAHQRARGTAKAIAERTISPAGLTIAPTIIDNSFFNGNKFSDPFCATYSGTKLSEQCAALTEDSCNLTDCCVYVNGNKCKAGNAQGPASITGVMSDAEYYSYKYQCYGNCSDNTQRVYRNNGTVSCDRYCAGIGGGSWNNELPPNWGGAVCVKAGIKNDQPCASVVGYSQQGTQCLCERSDDTPWAQ